MDNQWKIRLLGSVLQGREIWLPDTGLTLGERGCDVCLPLTHAAKVTLTIKDGTLYADAGALPMWVNGRRQRQSTALPAAGILQTAGLTMAFGSQHDDLADIPLPSRSTSIFWVGVLAVLLMAAMLTGLWLNGDTKEIGSGIPEQVNTMLQQPGMGKVKATWAPDGVLTLSGYCPEEAQMQTVRMKLASWGVLFRDRVARGDLIARDVQDVLMQAGYSDARVRSTAPGEVRIQGDITMGKCWSAVLPQLQQIPGLTRWHIENTHETQSSAIIAALSDSGLVGELSVTPVRDTFTISGVLDRSREQRLDQILDRLRARFPGLSITYQAVPASADGARLLPSPVAGIIHGRHGDYLVLENGVRLQVGNQLPGGGEVVALNDRAVAIKYRGALINYPFGF